MADRLTLDPVDMAKVPFANSLLPAQVEALCRAGELRQYHAGEVVFRQGEPGQELFVVIDGEVGVDLSVGGVDRRLATLGPGTIFGEVNFLVGSERTATALALREARLLSFRRDAVQALEGIGRQAAANMMETIARVLAMRLATMNRELAQTFERLAASHPDAAELIRASDERRQALLHSWAY